ncbi:hypothetical protein EDB92DRAFT_1814478 [Lactarius akahatsu]|uniref:Uncharacterized protein n=1 Tax=Lactarius akahatsu TaxID=416441 RepID=A0AAD4QFQ7_9AGAM|nr:hypothetical protein EDB92DRAFT_1814478 [Lactarius akahatsu]
MSAKSALTHAEVDYRKANIDSKIQQHLTTPSQEHSDESFARFIMAIDLFEPCMTCTIELDVLVDRFHAHSSARTASVALPATSAATACAEVAAVVEVNTNTEHIVAAGTASPARPIWKGYSNMWSSLATFLGSELWSCARCTSSGCAISTKLCFQNVQSDESKWGWRRDGRRDADRRMPKGTLSVSKLILSMSRMLVSAMIGSVGGAVSNWFALFASVRVCTRAVGMWFHHLVWGFLRPDHDDGDIKNHDDGDVIKKARSHMETMHRWEYSEWR